MNIKLRIRIIQLAVLFLTGLLYRLLFIKAFPQPFVFDQVQYQEYADSIKTYGLYAHSFRLYGYPLFLFLIEKFLGRGIFLGLYTWQIVQVLLDTITGLLVLGAARLLFKKLSIAVFSYVFYLINPFTSGYTGVMLPEVWAAFLFGLLYYLGIKFMLFGPTISAIFIGILLGFIPQVRPAYFLFSFTTLLLISIYIYKQFSKNISRICLVLLAISFIIPNIYTVWGNYRWFNQFSLMDVDNLSIENLYVSLFIERSIKIPSSIYEYPKEVQWAYSEYSYRKDTLAKRKATQDLFIQASIEEIKNNPLKFLIWRVEKMWYVWEKHYIFPYFNPQSPLLLAATYWGNLIMLSLFAVGYFIWAKRV